MSISMTFRENYVLPKIKHFFLDSMCPIVNQQIDGGDDEDYIAHNMRMNYLFKCTWESY